MFMQKDLRRKQAKLGILLNVLISGRIFAQEGKKKNQLRKGEIIVREGSTKAGKWIVKEI